MPDETTPTTPAPDNTVTGELMKAPPPRREVRVVMDESLERNLLDTGRFDHLQRVSTLMAASSLLPEHLRTEKEGDKTYLLDRDVIVANCFRIVNQALRWGFDPFSMIDETYVHKGKLGYQGKLVAAVINTRAGIKGRLKYSFTGSGNDRTVICSATFDGDDEPSVAELKLSNARTKNAMWATDPDQKLIYSVVMKWARRHCPEVVMGVLTDDDVERIAMNDPPPGQKPGLDLNTRVESMPAADPKPAVPTVTTVGTAPVKPAAAPDEPTTPQKPAADADAQKPDQAAVAGQGDISTADGPPQQQEEPQQRQEPIEISSQYGEDNEEPPDQDPPDAGASAENQPPAAPDAPAAAVVASPAMTENQFVNFVASKRPDGMGQAAAVALVEKRLLLFLPVPGKWDKLIPAKRLEAIGKVEAGKFNWKI